MPKMKRSALVIGAALLLLGGAPASQDPALGRRTGQMHPDFLLPSLDGEAVRLSDFRGKKVFLFHFASW